MDEESPQPIVTETVITDVLLEDGTRIYTVVVEQEEL